MIPAKTQTHDLSPFSLALSAPKLRTLQDDLLKEVKTIYRLALISAGHTNFDIETVQLQASVLSSILLENYGGVTIEELRIAAKKGAVGEYGEFMGISPKTFIDWIKAYQNSHARKMAIRELKEVAVKQLQTTMSESAKVNFWNEAQARFKKKGTITGEIFLYKIGRELGKIEPGDEMFMEEVKFKALKWFETEYEALKISEGLGARVALEKIREVINSTEEERSKKMMWQNRCKRIAVQITFDSKD